MSRLRLLLVASLAAVSIGCATWVDNRDSRGAGKAGADVAIFKAHLANTRRIVSTSDGRVEYQYDPAQKQTMWSAQHQRVRLLPGQYTITAKTWPFGTIYEFEVELEAGHKYKVETDLCTLKCLRAGKPYRDDRWIQDLTTDKRISRVVSECYLANTRGRERRKVPCPDKEAYSESRTAGKATAKAATGEAAHGGSSAAEKSTAEVAAGEGASGDSPVAGKATAKAAKSEKTYRDARSTGKAKTEGATFKLHPANTRQIVSTSDGRVEYQYNPDLERTGRSDSHSHIQLPAGKYAITAKTWPFGSLNEFKVDLEAGHVYEVETSICSLDCILSGEPYRSDRWIQDLTTDERISGIESECYLAKPRGGERRRVPCPDD